jgi:hypothetical protein
MIPHSGMRLQTATADLMRRPESTLPIMIIDSASSARSALPPRADIVSPASQVRKVPKAEIDDVLFDQLVGASEKRRWDGYADRLCRLEVDDEIEFGGLLHRKITRLLTTKNSISVLGHSPESIYQVVSVGDETACLNRAGVGEKRGRIWNPESALPRRGSLLVEKTPVG